ncbi:uncharacterized protein LOC132280813 [Cornus florida]|uniref:uncharacterized protein LOC132280813 n=1 Tax=Cornus florida TaxID=4283 RepID=UPI00289DBD85|nr:uncharacterized protein LOC132280813 [Cornus florida]
MADGSNWIDAKDEEDEKEGSATGDGGCGALYTLFLARVFRLRCICKNARQYQRTPNEDDIARLLRKGEERGFPGMLGSIDCMHWVWKNCPTGWHGTHRGGNHKPTLILEAVASKDLWVWHAFFGMAGSNNDVNVLDHSLVFNSLINGTMPLINYEVNGHRRAIGYYLSDSIYPMWTTLIQIIPHPTTGKEKLFANKQEVVRKDVE